MKNQSTKTVPLGELILAVFEKAATYSADPREVACLATQAVEHMLERSQNLAISRRPSDFASLEETASIRSRARQGQASATAPT